MKNSQALTDFMQTHLPIAQQLGLYVKEYNEQGLSLAAPLYPNINDKATAFGGSIYCVAVMACWGTLYLQAIEHGLEAPNIVVAKGEINYEKPVVGEIVASCDLPDSTTMARFWREYAEKQKVKITLNASITVADETLVSFSGLYAII